MSIRVSCLINLYLYIKIKIKIRLIFYINSPYSNPYFDLPRNYGKRLLLSLVPINLGQKLCMIEKKKL